VIDLVWAQRFVYVGDPGHFARAGAQVGCGHIAARIDVASLDQLTREAPGDDLQVVHAVLPGVNRQYTLCAPKRDIDDGVRAFN